jgi:hypothetical protein
MINKNNSKNLIGFIGGKWILLLFIESDFFVFVRSGIRHHLGDLSID